MKRLQVLVPLIVLAACAAPSPTPADLPVLGDSAQARRFAAWQQALEHNTGGETTSWSDSGEVRGSIAPIDTVRSGTDGWCRDYEEVIAEGAKQYRVVGIACRKQGPRWLVLDVRAFTD
jgi:surface antigen